MAVTSAPGMLQSTILKYGLDFMPYFVGIACHSKRHHGHDAGAKTASVADGVLEIVDRAATTGRGRMAIRSIRR